MTPEEARDHLHAGRKLVFTVGDDVDDPTIVLSLDDGMVIAESIGGWSNGVVEPVCHLESTFLEAYFGTHAVEIYDGA